MGGKKFNYIFLWPAVSIILLGIFPLSHSAFLRCYKGSLNTYTVTSLGKPMSLMSSTCFDRYLPTVIYTFGYRGKVTGPATMAVVKSYLERKKRNVVLLDWEEEAKSGLLGIPLGYALTAVPNAHKVGDELGDALVKLAGAGLNMTDIHLLGHSLGAHIMGHAGRRTRENGHVVASLTSFELKTNQELVTLAVLNRISGLDPARALFEGSLTFQRGLDRGCAKFVDIIHTDPGGYGTSKPAGTVDVWPNYAGSGGTQPGCPAGDFEMFSTEDLCSHDRSWKYLVEAVNSPTSFPAVGAKDYSAWVNGLGRSVETIFMGDLTSTRARGNFFLTTNRVAPFSRSNKGLIPEENQTRNRRNPALTRILKYFR